MTESDFPTERVRRGNDAPVRRDRDFVLYWMIASRRTRFHYGLERAAMHAASLGKPLLVLEALRCGYRWASDRIHAFVLQGMRDNARAFEERGVGYHPYVEPQAGAGSGLVEALAKRACVVVTDDFPCFFQPRMVAAVARRLDVMLEDVDANGLLPLRATDRTFPSAYAFRRFLQGELPRHLGKPPAEDPLDFATRLPRAELPREIARRWPRADVTLLDADPDALAALPIDHEVPATECEGGPIAAGEALDAFLRSKLDRYHEERSAPDEEVQSFLSPYLHFGHLSVHEVFDRVREREDWDVTRLATKASGKRSGWWGMSEAAESFLDQMITWREIGYNLSSHTEDYDRYDSLPLWARKTLAAHERDPRPHLYSLEELAQATTHDDLWNAAQNQLLREGRIHNYLRMLWGKKILEWSQTPRAALETMIELNNRYALDGRDPSSYSGIFWILGRYDRPWGPERKVFGTVRYMSSEDTARKLPVEEYLARYG